MVIICNYSSQISTHGIFLDSSFPSILDNQCIRASYRLVSKTSSVFTSLCCYGYVCGPRTHHLSPGWTGALGSTNAIIIVSNRNSASNLNVWWLPLKYTCFIGESGTRQTNQMQQGAASWLPLSLLGRLVRGATMSFPNRNWIQARNKS